MADITTLRPKAIIYDRVAELLTEATEYPSYFGEGGTNKVQKQCWNWEPGPMVPSGPTEIGAYPRRLHDLACTFAVSCRAAEYDDACEMAADLVTAVEQVMLGKSYSIGPFEIVEGSGESSASGWSIIVPLSVTIALPESKLGTTGFITGTVESVAYLWGRGLPNDPTPIALDETLSDARLFDGEGVGHALVDAGTYAARWFKFELDDDAEVTIAAAGYFIVLARGTTYAGRGTTEWTPEVDTGDLDSELAIVSGEDSLVVTLSAGAYVFEVSQVAAGPSAGTIPSVSITS